MRRGTDHSKTCFFMTTVNRFYFYFFCLSHQEEMRSGTHFTQQNVLLPVRRISSHIHVQPHLLSTIPYIEQSLRVVHDLWIGSGKKMLFFQMVPKSFLRVLIHSSTRCKYDSLDFFFENFDWNLPVGRVKVKIVGFWLE